MTWKHINLYIIPITNCRNQAPSEFDLDMLEDFGVNVVHCLTFNISRLYHITIFIPQAAAYEEYEEWLVFLLWMWGDCVQTTWFPTPYAQMLHLFVFVSALQGRELMPEELDGRTFWSMITTQTYHLLAAQLHQSPPSFIFCHLKFMLETFYYKSHCCELLFCLHDCW